MAQRYFRDEALEAGPVVGGPATLTLVVIDDEHAVLRPAERDGMVRQGILAFPRLAVLQDLLGAGLTHINQG